MAPKVIILDIYVYNTFYLSENLKGRRLCVLIIIRVIIVIHETKDIWFTSTWTLP